LRKGIVGQKASLKDKRIYLELRVRRS